MKLAISNLAWDTAETNAIAELLVSFAVKGVEIAPTKIWSDPTSVTKSETEAYKSYWQNYAIEIVSLQSLLFGRPELTIFESKEKRLATRSYLSSLIELAARLGANVLVFGSPKNRLIGNLPLETAIEIAVDFFGYLGQIASDYGVKFCLEPNPQLYGCDFINTSTDGYNLVTRTNSPGFGLHLDAAGMTLSQERIETSLEQALPQLCHFHISEPNLQIIGSGGVNHQLFAQTLTHLNYQGWTSIEMLTQNKQNNLDNVRKALITAIKYYGS